MDWNTRCQQLSLLSAELCRALREAKTPAHRANLVAQWRRDASAIHAEWIRTRSATVV